ncbi:hypothetical protein sos41_37480 [Alphaproteobacteria bacterium SO-S41]|nr:hypothetical protein sos41_37480 [Alphaproteobacteria bacterium SO-S41]
MSDLPPPAARKGVRTSSIIVLVVVLGALAFAATKCSSIIRGIGSEVGDAAAGLTGDYKKQPRFLDIMKLVGNDPRVIAALGSPVTEQGLYNYAYSAVNGQVSVTYGINLAGPTAKGTADVVAEDHDGKTVIVSAAFKDAKGKLTNLLVSD